MTLREKHMNIQVKLKAPKNMYNSFGKYSYRNCEGICEAVKQFLEEYKCSLILKDDIKLVGDRFYVLATATLMDMESDETIEAYGFAREPLEKKGMDESQITGTASSYARKYALNGLFILDDTKDPDTDEYHEQTHQEAPKAAAPKKDTGWGDKKIETKHAYVFKKKCEEAGVDPAEIASRYDVKQVMDMTMGQFNAMMKELEKKCEAQSKA